MFCFAGTTKKPTNLASLPLALLHFGACCLGRQLTQFLDRTEMFQTLCPRIHSGSFREFRYTARFPQSSYNINKQLRNTYTYTDKLRQE